VSCSSSHGAISTSNAALKIADIMGHKQLTMVKRYAHLTVHTKATLVNRVLGWIK
jgi:hypothetical protein